VVKRKGEGDRAKKRMLNPANRKKRRPVRSRIYRASTIPGRNKVGQLIVGAGNGNVMESLGRGGGKGYRRDEWVREIPKRHMASTWKGDARQGGEVILERGEGNDWGNQSTSTVQAEGTAASKR